MKIPDYKNIMGTLVQKEHNMVLFWKNKTKQKTRRLVHL